MLFENVENLMTMDLQALVKEVQMVQQQFLIAEHPGSENNTILKNMQEDSQERMKVF